METWIIFGTNIILTIAGLLVYSIWKVRDKLKIFDWGIFLSENKGFWIWALSLQTIFALLIALAPDAPEAIKSIVGLDYTQPMAFFSTGYMLGGLANGASKDKIGSKNTQ